MSQYFSKMQTPRGMRDLFGDDIHYYDYIFGVAQKRFNQSGFKRIATPICENTDVFTRIGTDTDIVSKEMYTFEDRGENSLTLRPEFTAGVIRAYLQNHMNQFPQPVSLWSMGPTFRYDRPQKGRYRQFYQLSAEIIGEKSPYVDAQAILLCRNMLSDLGLLDHITLQLNCIGDRDSRAAYMKALAEYYVGKDRSLCGDCLRRRDGNIMRLLDCKEEDCRILAELAPTIVDYLSDDDVSFYSELKTILNYLGISYVENSRLVRGLDYYSLTVFEFWNDHDGAQNSLGGGGRYDYLVEEMGGQHTPAVGFAFGVDRLFLEMEDKGVLIPEHEKIDVFVAGLGDDAKLQSVALIDMLHEAGVRCVGACGKPTMKAQLKIADGLKVKYALIIGEFEVKDGVVLVRDMERGSQMKVPFGDVVDHIVDVFGVDSIELT